MPSKELYLLTQGKIPLDRTSLAWANMKVTTEPMTRPKSIVQKATTTAATRGVLSQLGTVPTA